MSVRLNYFNQLCIDFITIDFITIDVNQHIRFKTIHGQNIATPLPMLCLLKERISSQCVTRL